MARPGEGGLGLVPSLPGPTMAVLCVGWQSARRCDLAGRIPGPEPQSPCGFNAGTSVGSRLGAWDLEPKALAMGWARSSLAKIQITRLLSFRVKPWVPSPGISGGRVRLHGLEDPVVVCVPKINVLQPLVVNEHALQSQSSGVQIRHVPLAGCVILSELLNLSVPPPCL